MVMKSLNEIIQVHNCFLQILLSLRFVFCNYKIFIFQFTNVELLKKAKSSSLVKYVYPQQKILLSDVSHENGTFHVLRKLLSDYSTNWTPRKFGRIVTNWLSQENYHDYVGFGRRKLCLHQEITEKLEANVLWNKGMKGYH